MITTITLDCGYTEAQIKACFSIPENVARCFIHEKGFFHPISEAALGSSESRTKGE